MRHRLFIQYIKIRGYLRLRHGFCPLCNSSPPDKKCFVCYGNQTYGQDLDLKTRLDWKRYFDQFVRFYK